MENTKDLVSAASRPSGKGEKGQGLPLLRPRVCVWEGGRVGPAACLPDPGGVHAAEGSAAPRSGCPLEARLGPARSPAFRGGGKWAGSSAGGGAAQKQERLPGEAFGLPGRVLPLLSSSPHRFCRRSA